LVTTEPAPTNAYRPTLTPQTIVALAPMGGGAASLQTCGFVQRVPVNLRPWISNIRQHTRWPEKYVVLDQHACVDGYIVLDLDVASYYRAAIDVHVLRDHAALTDSRTLHNVREVPYLRAGSNFRAFINIGGLVYKVRTVLLAILWLERFRSTYCFPILQTNRFTRSLAP